MSVISKARVRDLIFLIGHVTIFFVPASITSAGVLAPVLERTIVAGNVSQKSRFSTMLIAPGEAKPDGFSVQKTCCFDSRARVRASLARRRRRRRRKKRASRPSSRNTKAASKRAGVGQPGEGELI